MCLPWVLPSHSRTGLCPSCLDFIVWCPVKPLVCPCSLVCLYRDYIRKNCSKEFWFCSSKNVHVHRSWKSAWQGGFKMPVYWISWFIQSCKFLCKFLFATQLTNWKKKLNIQKIGNEGNCISVLLFEDMILKCRLFSMKQLFNS